MHPVSESEAARKVRQGIEHFNEGDFEAIRPLLAEDFEMHRVLYGHVDGEVIRGAGAFIEWMGPEVFSSMQVEIRDLREADGRVLVEIGVRAVGAGSGIEIALDSFQVWEHDGERIHRLTTFRDLADAERQAGLGDV